MKNAKIWNEKFSNLNAKWYQKVGILKNEKIEARRGGKKEVKRIVWEVFLQVANTESQ